MHDIGGYKTRRASFASASGRGSGEPMFALEESKFKASAMKSIDSIRKTAASA